MVSKRNLAALARRVASVNPTVASDLDARAEYATSDEQRGWLLLCEAARCMRLDDHDTAYLMLSSLVARRGSDPMA